MSSLVKKVWWGVFCVAAVLAPAPHASADDTTGPVAPPAIRLGDVPDDHAAVLYDDGETVWWCAGDLDPGYTVCEKAVVYPAGSFGF